MPADFSLPSAIAAASTVAWPVPELCGFFMNTRPLYSGFVKSAKDFGTSTPLSLSAFALARMEIAPVTWPNHESFAPR